MSDSHTVVLDIGKTNKKLLVYDSGLHCLNEATQEISFKPIICDGLLCDDMASIYDWMIGALQRAAEEYPSIRAISVSTHGATIALLGGRHNRIFQNDGGLVFPIVSYEHDIGADADDAFYRDIDMSREEAQRSSATASFGWLLNHAKQIHYLQDRYGKRFAEVTDILMFPQYLTYLLTGVKSIDPTCIGCHGYLLDAGGERYSDIAQRLGVADKLPPLPARNTWEALGRVSPNIASATGLSSRCVVTMGVHDSNAALVPYFAKGLADFVLQDSGTWVVTMVPWKGHAEFSENELGREVFFNRSIYGKPVKTTIFRGGAEFDFFRQNILTDKPRPDDIDIEILGKTLSRREAFSLPTIARGSGLFPNHIARLEGIDAIFKDAVTAWLVVDLGLALQGALAIEMAAGGDVREIYIEGNIGRNNPVYRSVISSMFPDAEVFFGSMGGAVFGAALMGLATIESVRPEELSGRFDMDLTKVPKLDLDVGALRAYADAFRQRLV